MIRKRSYSGSSRTNTNHGKNLKIFHSKEFSITGGNVENRKNADKTEKFQVKQHAFCLKFGQTYRNEISRVTRFITQII